MTNSAVALVVHIAHAAWCQLIVKALLSARKLLHAVCIDTEVLMLVQAVTACIATHYLAS